MSDAVPDWSAMIAFVRVVQEGGFTAAARVLGVPKARISRKVRELEERLGTPLLKRTTRRLGLTEAGHIYLAYCEKLIRDMADAEEAVASLGARPRGWLRVTAASWLATDVLAPMFPAFRAEYPDIMMDVMATHEPLDMVSLDVDLAFRLWIGDLPSSDLVARLLCKLPMHIYASAEYARRHDMPTRPEELIDHPALVTHVRRPLDVEQWWLTDGQVAGSYPIRAVAVASDPGVLKAMMLAGEGLLLATEIQMRTEVAAGRATSVMPAWRGHEPGLYAVMPAARAHPPKVRALVDFMAPRLKRAATRPPERESE
ncbi:LysR family transcriptional regulator [Pseudochelatococcus sp. B33]